VLSPGLHFEDNLALHLAVAQRAQALGKLIKWEPPSNVRINAALLVEREQLALGFGDTLRCTVPIV